MLLRISLPVVRFSCLNRARFLLRDKRLFKISEAEITGVDCIGLLLNRYVIKTN